MYLKQILMVTIFYLVLSCNNTFEPHKKSDIAGVWRSVHVDRNTNTTIIGINDSICNIRSFSSNSCSTFYDNNFPVHISDYDSAYISDTIIVFSPTSGKHIKTGEIRKYPYSLKDDTLKITLKDYTMYYVRYVESFPPVEWERYSQAVDSIEVTGSWIAYKASNDKKFLINLTFNNNNKYLEIIQNYEIGTPYYKNAFIPDTSTGIWTIKDGQLHITYDSSKTSHKHSYEISDDTLTFDIWDKVSGYKFFKAPYKIDKNSWILYNKCNSALTGNSILDIDITNQEKWIAEGNGAGVVVFRNNTWERYDTSNSPIPSNSISCIRSNNENVTWFGTTQGVASFHNGQWNVYDSSDYLLKSNMVTDIEIDRDGDVWIGTGAGIARYDGLNWFNYNYANTGIFTSEWADDQAVRSISVDSTNTIWFASSSSIITYNKNLSIWTTYTSIGYLPVIYDIDKIIATKDGMWFGNFSHGIATYLHSDGKSTVFNSSQNSPIKGSITDMTNDKDGRVWFSTYAGLLGFDGRKWILLDKRTSSIPSNNITAVVSDDNGKIWIVSGEHYHPNDRWLVEYNPL